MHTQERPDDILQMTARIVALIMVGLVISLAAFPWLVPFIWEMPENTTAPYYGLLIYIEMARTNLYSTLQAKSKKEA